MESSPSASSPSTVIDFEGKGKLLTTVKANSSEQRRPLDKKRKKVEMSNGVASKIPVRVSPSRKGAFRFVQTRDERSSSSDAEPTETEELKKKFQEEKRQRKRKGQLLEQLHENYNDLLEKYAQAENTIDQLRFQPKFTVDDTPLSSIRPLASSSTATPVMAMTQSRTVQLLLFFVQFLFHLSSVNRSFSRPIDQSGR